VSKSKGESKLRHYQPTSALDKESGHLIMELMRRFALRKDRVLIVVTHDARIFEFADRIARMEDGHIIGIDEQPGQPNGTTNKP
jgi:putative ABC transport system ATP-binding protein